MFKLVVFYFFPNSGKKNWNKYGEVIYTNKPKRKTTENHQQI